MTASPKPSFNLVDRPWIPCLIDGKLTELSLAEALTRAHEVQQIHDDSPLVVAALHRLLLAVLHSALRGPKRLADWRAIWSAGTFAQAWLLDYLARWRPRFDLFDPVHPFFQVPGLPHEPVSPSKLAHQLASGNNATLFDHTVDEERVAVPAALAARRLCAFSCYAMGGLVSRQPGEPSSARSAPLVAGIAVLVRGVTLFETLCLNLLLYDPTQAKPIPGGAGDRPAWEATATSSREVRAPHGWLDWLTWPSRRVMLVASGARDDDSVVQVRLAGGTELPEGFSLRVREPWFAYKRKSQTLPLAALRFDPLRAVWRDSTALFRLGSEEEHPPRATEQVSELVSDGVLQRERTLDYELLGLANDQAKVLLWRRERLTLPVRVLGNVAALDALRTGLDEAHAVHRILWGALASAAEVLLSPESDREGRRPQGADVTALVKSLQAEAAYWSPLALAFERFLPGLAEDSSTALHTWRVATHATAIAAFERACRSMGSSAQGLKAQAIGERRLRSGLHATLPALSPGRPQAGAALRTGAPP